MKEPIAYKNDNGIWIYNRLPEGMRIATEEDFYENNELILGMKFLAKSFHFPRYEAHTVSSNFLNKWSIWLKEGYLYIV